jgi:hypothetical protein
MVSINEAASITNCLILDANGDSNAVFIIKIDGAFSTGPGSKVNLINGASANNMYWVVEGAISLGAGTSMKGNLIAHIGAISMAAGTHLEGRALSTTGAVAIDGTTVRLSKGSGSPVLTGPIPPALGTTADYAIFSTNGLVTDNGISTVVGDIGTNLGVTSGYTPVNITGTIHGTPDASTATCSVDVLSVYNYLNALPYDIELLYPAQLGNSLVLTPHVYIMNGASVLTDTLFLNAEGNANAVFVIKINAALTTSTNAKVKLINQAQSKNIFWVINGSATLNNYCSLVGTVICNNSAINLNIGANIHGSIFTTTGTITTISDNVLNTNITSINVSDSIYYCPILTTLPVSLTSFSVECTNQGDLLEWSTATESNSDYFLIEQSMDGINWQIITKVSGAGNSTSINNYSFVNLGQHYYSFFYRLKQTDYDGLHRYSKIIHQDKCNDNEAELIIYPNPATETLNLSYTGEKSQVRSISIYNVLGKMVYYSELYQSKIALGEKFKGVYFLHLNFASTNIVEKFLAFD